MKYVVVCCTALMVFSASAQAGVGFGVQGNVINFNLGYVATPTNVSLGNFTGDIKDIYGIGFGGGIHFDVKMPILSFRVSGDYVTLSPDKGKYTNLVRPFLGAAASALNIDGGKIDIYSVNANLKLTILPLPVVSIYGTGGAGYVRVVVADANVTFNGLPLTTLKVEAQNKPSVNAGAGVDLSLGGLTLFGELKVTWIFSDPKTSTAIPYGTVGLTF